MNLTQGIENYKSALILKDQKAIILSDLHIGAEKTMILDGTLIPRTQYKKIRQLIEELLKRFRPEKVILNGDIKHNFGTINKDEWKDVLELIDLIKESSGLTVILGNHDILLDKILKKKGVVGKNHERMGEFYITHGDRKPSTESEKKDFKDSKTIIIGHEHPTITLDNGVRREKFKAFLTGNYKDKKIVLMPSTYPLIEGADILGNSLGPYFPEITDLRAYILEDDDTYDFGRVDALVREEVITLQKRNN